MDWNSIGKRIGEESNMDDGYAKGTICISLGKYNTKEDAEEIVAALAKIVGRYS